MISTFFRPDDSFLVWLKAYARDRPVFDVGCGNGEFLKRMWSAGIKAMGIDLNADQIEDFEIKCRTLWEDATKARVLKEYAGLVLFCRPNHTGWVADTIVQLHTDSEVLYISLPGNDYIDLPEFKTEVVDAPGLISERAFRALKPYPVFERPNYWIDEVQDLLKRMRQK